MSSIVVAGDTSGSVTLSAPAVSGSSVLTLPVATDTLVGKATTDTLTNKTLTSPTLTAPALGTPASGILTSCTGLNYDGFKNRIINGAMVIDQRNAGASVTPANTGQYLVDRWQYNGSQASKVTAQQNAGSVTPPAGFINYQGITSSSAYSITASDYFQVFQPIEGLNCTDLGWGTANAKTITISAWVYSSLTGTFGGSLRNSATNRSYPFSYSIPTANTWTQISVTIAGDTSGTWLTSSGIGILLSFSLSMGTTYSNTAGAWAAGNFASVTGATSVVGTNGATFYITGVQLEKGSTATSFDYRPYGTELALCQRYYWKSLGSSASTGMGSGYVNTSTVASFYIKYSQPMRAVPTSTQSTMKIGYTGNEVSVSGINASYLGLDSGMMQYTGSGLTNGQGVCLYTTNSSSYIDFSAEL